MKTSASDTIGFLVGALAGFLLWVVSLRLTSRPEPWDGNPAGYRLALLLIGLGVTFATRGRIRSPYLGAVLGQVVFATAPAIACPASGWLCEFEPDLGPMTLAALLVYSLPALGGSALAHWLAGLGGAKSGP